MEIKAELKQPYTEKERIDFIVEWNHKKGYEIVQTPEKIEAWGMTQEEIEIEKKKARNQEIKEKVKELQEMALPEIVKGNSTEEYQKVIDRLLENLVIL